MCVLCVSWLVEVEERYASVEGGMFSLEARHAACTSAQSPQNTPARKLLQAQQAFTLVKQGERGRQEVRHESGP